MKALAILNRFSNKCESALGFNGEYVATLGEINDAITELKELLKPKTCDGCIYWRRSYRENFGDCVLNVSSVPNADGITMNTFCCNEYEPKDIK